MPVLSRLYHSTRLVTVERPLTYNTHAQPVKDASFVYREAYSRAISHLHNYTACLHRCTWRPHLSVRGSHKADLQTSWLPTAEWIDRHSPFLPNSASHRSCLPSENGSTTSMKTHRTRMKLRWAGRPFLSQTCLSTLMACRRMALNISYCMVCACSVAGVTYTIGVDWMIPCRRNANLLPHITRVDNPYAIPEASVDVAAGPSTSCNSTKPAMLSEEWRSLVEERFKNLRKVCVKRAHFRDILTDATSEYGPTHDQRSSSPSAKYNS